MNFMFKSVAIVIVTLLINACERVRLDVDNSTEKTGVVIPLGADCIVGNSVEVKVEVAGVPAESVMVQALCDATQVVFTDATVGAAGQAGSNTAQGTQVKGQAGCKVSPTITTSTFSASCIFQ